MSWLRQLARAEDLLPFEQGLLAGLRTYAARLILFALSAVFALVIVLILAIALPRLKS